MPSCGSKPGLCEADQKASVGKQLKKKGEGSTVRLGVELCLSSRTMGGGEAGAGRVCTGLAHFSFLNKEPTYSKKQNYKEIKVGKSVNMNE